MPDQSTILSLPHILPSQAQKHVTHNEALRLLDVMVQLAVQSRTLTAPPVSPVLGDRYIIAPSPTGDWSGRGRDIALWNGTAWEFFNALQGWRAYVAAEGVIVIFDGSDWVVPAGGVAQFTQLGVNMAADATNKLAVESAAALFTNPAGSHQMAINKGSNSATGSVMFQQGFLTRAEMGLVGTNDFSVKVSPDGVAFFAAMTINKDNGRTTMEQPMRLNPAASDPAAPADGFIWYNSTTGKFRGRQAGASVDLIGAGGGGSAFSDAVFRIEDDVDATKKAAFQAAAISTGTTRTYDLPNTSGVLALLSGTQTFSGQTTFSNASVTVGSAAAASSIGIGTGAQGTGVSKDIAIGTGGLSGSVTNVSIGSAVGGALGQTVISSPTLTVGSSAVTMANAATVAMGSANVTAQQLGLGGATADATNRLSVNAPGVLFNNAGSGIEATLNKAATGDNARVTFMTGFSTRAQFGLSGTNDFSLRVSPDGSTFNDGLSVAAATGSVTLARPMILTGQAADPGSPGNGTMWYNSTSGQLKAQVSGETIAIDGQRDVPFLMPVTGEFVIASMGAGSTLSTVAGVAARVDMFPYVARATFAITGIALNCTTAVAAALAKFAVYASDANGRPDARLLETADVDLSTVGAKTATASLTMVAGRTYWLAVRTSSTATISIFAMNATPDINGGTPSASARKLLRRTVVYGVPAPTNWGFLSSEISNFAAPAVWLRV